MRNGKRYKEASQLVEKDKYYELDEAVELVKKAATAKRTIAAVTRWRGDARNKNFDLFRYWPVCITMLK